MSTPATEAHFDASQAEVARGDQVPSKRTPRGGLGKTASAGFAQILGEQVAKSRATTKVAEETGEQPVPHTAGPHTMPQSLPPSPSHATPQSLPASLPQAAPQSLPASPSHATPQSSPQSLPEAAPQSLPAAGEKEVPHVVAQIRFDRSDHASPDTSHALAQENQHVANDQHRTSGKAPLARAERSKQESDAGSPVRVAAPLQASSSTVEPTVSSTETPLFLHKNTPPPAPISNLVHKIEGQSENPRRTVAPNPEAPSTTNAHVTHDTVRAIHPQDTASVQGFAPKTPSTSPSMHSPAHGTNEQIGHIAAAPARSNEERISASQTSLSGIAVSHTRAPSASATAAPAHEQIRVYSSTANHEQQDSAPNRSPSSEANHASAPAKTGNSAAHPFSRPSANMPRVSIEASETAAPVLFKVGETTAQVPAPASNSAARATAKPSDSTPRASVKPRETATPAHSQPGNDATQVAAQSNRSTAHVRSAASETAPRLSTKTSETTAPVASKSAETAVQTPVPTNTADAHVKPATNESTPHVSTKTSETTARVLFKSGESAAASPSPTEPEIPLSDAREHSTTPPLASGSFDVPAQAEHVTHMPGSESVPNPREPHAGEPSAIRTPAPLPANPVEQPSTSPPAQLSQQGSRSAGEPPTKELPRATPTPAPRASSPDIHPRVPVTLAPEPTARTEGKGISPQSSAHVDHPDGASASSTREQKAQPHPIPAQPLPVARAISQPSSQPSPPTITQAATTAHEPRIPQPVAPAEAPPPTMTVKPGAKAVIVKPATVQPTVPEETRSVESNADLKAPLSSAPRTPAASAEATLAARDPSATASPKLAPTSPAPETVHIGKKNPVEPGVGRPQAHAADEKEAEKPAPAKSAQANPLPSLASPSTSVEFKASKPEVLPSAEPRTITENSAQPSQAPSAAAQSHAMKDGFQPSILAPAEHPATLAPQYAFLPANEAGTLDAPAPSVIAAERAGLVDRAIEDPGLSVTVMPHSAHLAIAGDTGDLALHVRVRDGSADVNVSGTMAPLFDSKAHEVRTVLAGEGLQLGSFATDQRGSSHGQQGQPESAPRPSDPPPLPPPRRANTSAPEIQITNDRRIHVTA